MASSAAALCIAPACTVSSGSDSTEGGAGGDGNTTTGGTSTGGTSTGGAPAGGAPGEGGMTGDAGAATTGGVGGETAGGAAGDSGAAGAGGASGKVCTNPATDETSAKGDTCAVYCSSYLSTCAAFNTSDSTFADESECLTTCELFDDAQLCCRAQHVRNAAVSASAVTTHCPHAAGNSVCN